MLDEKTCRSSQDLEPTKQMKASPYARASKFREAGDAAAAMRVIANGAARPLDSPSPLESRSASNKEDTMPDNTAIRPFKVGFPKADVTELRRRIAARRGLAQRDLTRSLDSDAGHLWNHRRQDAGGPAGLP